MPSVTSVPGELDSGTRQATIGTATMALPDEPYRIRTDPKPTFISDGAC